METGHPSTQAVNSGRQLESRVVETGIYAYLFIRKLPVYKLISVQLTTMWLCCACSCGYIVVIGTLQVSRIVMLL